MLHFFVNGRAIDLILGGSLLIVGISELDTSKSG